jgi:molybdenum cofactor biosynthesis enzyme
MKIKLLYTFFLLITSLLAHSQKTSIKVYSESDSLPIPFSHICIEFEEDKEYCATNTDGETEIKFQKNALISVSSVGFETIIDTLKTYNKNLNYFLR